MTRNEEIKTLQSLKGDTYFSQYFSAFDIDMMCENIRNDFAVEGGTQFAQKVEVYKRQVEEVREAARRKLLDIATKVLKAEVEGKYEWEVLTEEIGIEEVIKIKHAHGIDLEPSEIEYLVNKLV